MWKGCLTCECGFDARAADEEGLAPAVGRHAAGAHCMALRTPASSLRLCRRRVLAPNPLTRECQLGTRRGKDGKVRRSLGFARVRSFNRTPRNTRGLSERVRTGANNAGSCHAEGRGFESHHPLSNESPAQRLFFAQTLTVTGSSTGTVKLVRIQAARLGNPLPGLSGLRADLEREGGSSWPRWRAEERTLSAQSQRKLAYVRPAP